MDGAFPVCKGPMCLAAGEVLLRKWVLDSQERASERREGILAALFWFGSTSFLTFEPTTPTTQGF